MDTEAPPSVKADPSEDGATARVTSLKAKQGVLSPYLSGAYEFVAERAVKVQTVRGEGVVVRHPTTAAVSRRAAPPPPAARPPCALLRAECGVPPSFSLRPSAPPACWACPTPGRRRAGLLASPLAAPATGLPSLPPGGPGAPPNPARSAPTPASTRAPTHTHTQPGA